MTSPPGVVIAGMHLVTPDDTAAITVSDDHMALVRLILDLPAEQVATFRSLLGLGPDRVRALLDLADSQLALEGVLAEQPDPPVRLHVLRDGKLPYPIACRTRRDAMIEGREPATCLWVRDAAGVKCTTCGHWQGAEMARGEAILRALDSAQGRNRP